MGEKIEEAIEWFRSHKGDGWHYNEKGLVIAEQVASLTLALEQAKANSYPHMCRMDHPQIGHSTDEEMCPVCIERGLRESAERELEVRTDNYDYQRQRADRAERERDDARNRISDLIVEKDEARRELAEVKAAIPGLVWSVQFGTATRQSGTVAELQTRAESAERRLAEAEGREAKKDAIIGNWREMGLSLWAQYASYQTGVYPNSKTEYSNGCLSVLEDLEHCLESLGLINAKGEPQWAALQSPATATEGKP